MVSWGLVPVGVGWRDGKYEAERLNPICIWPIYEAAGRRPG